MRLKRPNPPQMLGLADAFLCGRGRRGDDSEDTGGGLLWSPASDIVKGAELRSGLTSSSCRFTLLPWRSVQTWRHVRLVCLSSLSYDPRNKHLLMSKGPAPSTRIINSALRALELGSEQEQDFPFGFCPSYSHAPASASFSPFEPRAANVKRRVQVCIYLRCRDFIASLSYKPLYSGRIFPKGLSALSLLSQNV